MVSNNLSLCNTKKSIAFLKFFLFFQAAEYSEQFQAASDEDATSYEPVECIFTLERDLILLEILHQLNIFESNKGGYYMWLKVRRLFYQAVLKKESGGETTVPMLKDKPGIGQLKARFHHLLDLYRLRSDELEAPPILTSAMNPAHFEQRKNQIRNLGKKFRKVKREELEDLIEVFKENEDSISVKQQTEKLQAIIKEEGQEKQRESEEEDEQQKQIEELLFTGKTPAQILAAAALASTQGSVETLKRKNVSFLLLFLAKTFEKHLCNVIFFFPAWSRLL